VAPTVAEYLLAWQSVHVSDPAAVLYVPDLHSVQEPPSIPLAPALHVHAVETGLPNTESEFGRHVKHVETFVAPSVVEYVPIPHSVHVSDPSSSLYVPATHSEHALPSGPVDPALHVHAVDTGLPNRELEFVGHVKHVETFVAPSVAEYVPLSQSVHTPDPVSSLYVPATHSEHALPSGPVDPALHEHAVETGLPN